MPITNITSENFSEAVENSEKPVLIDFFASWCGPCQALSPVIDEVAQSENSIAFGKVNIDEEPSLAKKFSVMSVPTLVLLKDGKAVSSLVGLRSKDEVLEFINS